MSHSNPSHYHRRGIWTFFKELWKRIKECKSIYLTMIVHLADVLTDYLILCQYIVYAINQHNNNNNSDVNCANIDYLWVSIASFSVILFSKILFCWYVWKVTENKFDIFFKYI